MAEAAALVVEDLAVDYLGDQGRVRALGGVSFSIQPGEIFGLCGESGSGKSTLALALPRLLPPPAVISAGRVLLGGQDLFALSGERLRQVRGGRLALVPQSGMNALNPLLTIEDQLIDGIAAHAGAARIDAPIDAQRVSELLALVGLPNECRRAFPHQLSGGMRQRAVIAIALGPRPTLLVLDEATGGIDVVLQRHLTDQLQGLAERLGLAILFISHDLPLTLRVASRVGVLYAGRLIETAAAQVLHAQPQHPYTQALLGCFLDPRRRPAGAPAGIAGMPPDPRQLPPGCAFHPRCPLVFERCTRERPVLLAAGGDGDGDGNGQVACHLRGGA